MVLLWSDTAGVFSKRHEVGFIYYKKNFINLSFFMDSYIFFILKKVNITSHEIALRSTKHVKSHTLWKEENLKSTLGLLRNASS